MQATATYVPYRNTGYYSALINDMLDGHANVNPFIEYTADEEGINAAIERRENVQTDRVLLTNALLQQYDGIVMHEKVKALSSEAKPRQTGMP